MIENIRLDSFILLPHHRIGKEIELERNPRLRGLQLTDHQRHRLVHRDFVLQIAHQIGAEYPQIGLMQAVDLPLAGGDAVGGIISLDPLFGPVDVVAQQVDLAEVFQHLGRAEAHAGHVDRHRAHHAPPARELHGVPVRKGVGRQQVGRQHDQRIVPVADLHGRERHLLDRAVRAVLRDRDPVADLQHVVGRELDPRNEAHDAVPEDQHQDRRRSPESGQQLDGRLVDQNRDDQDRGNQRSNALGGLPQPLDGFVLPRGAQRNDMEGRAQQGVDQPHEGHDDADLGQPQGDGLRRGALVEDHREDDRQQDGDQDVAAAVEHLHAEEFVVPLHAGVLDQAADRAHDDQLQEKIEQGGSQQNQQECHPAIQRIAGGGRDAQPFQQGVRPTFQECLHTPGPCNFRAGSVLISGPAPLRLRNWG